MNIIKIFYIIKQNYIHRYFESVLFGWIKTYSYIFKKCLIQRSKIIFISALKMFCKIR